MYSQSMFLSKNKKKYQIFSSKNYHFFHFWKLLHIARTCFRNDKVVCNYVCGCHFKVTIKMK